jgi:hypothetical protein
MIHSKVFRGKNSLNRGLVEHHLVLALVSFMWKLRKTMYEGPYVGEIVFLSFYMEIKKNNA